MDQVLCFLSAPDNDDLNSNHNDNDGNNIIFTIKCTTFHVFVVTLLGRDNQK